MPDFATSAEALLERLGASLPKSVEELRQVIERFRALVNADLPPLGALHEAVPVAEGVAADVLVPASAPPHPVLVYLHGGGWVCGSPATHRKLAARFAEAGHLVVNVDYRLAPEHPFPAPFDDCVAAVRWAAREAARYGGDPRRLAIAGDSAGANLAAAASIALAGDPARPRAAVLIYGLYDFAALGEAPPEIGAEMMQLVVRSYLGPTPSPALLRDPRVSPIQAADRLPPCHVVVGGGDPLAGQAEALAAALRGAGVPHEHRVDLGMPHGYAQMEFLPPARAAIARMLEFLRAHA